MSYKYLDKKETSKKLKEKCENLIKEVQKSIRDFFTFTFKIIGSGSNNMITYDESNCIDVDYNLIIQNDKMDLLSNPQRVRDIFIQAFKNASGEDIKIKNKKNAICCKFQKKIDKYQTSMDVAIMVELDNGYLYKIYQDKNTSHFIWNMLKDSKERHKRIFLLKHYGLWNEVRKHYLLLKNDKMSHDIESYILLLRAINDIYMNNKRRFI